jgi:hypothetical protein
MAIKEKKMKDELEKLVMRAVETHRDRDHIVGVTIIPKIRAQLYQPNWEPSFQMADNRASPGWAYQIATPIQNKFDLA